MVGQRPAGSPERIDPRMREARLAPDPADRAAAGAHARRARPRRVLPARHRRRGPGGDAAARLDRRAPTSTGAAPTTTWPRPATACWRSTTAATAAGCAPLTPFRLADCAADAAAALRDARRRAGARRRLLDGRRDRPADRARPPRRGRRPRPQRHRPALAGPRDAPRVQGAWASLGLALSVAPRRDLGAAFRRAGLPDSAGDRLGCCPR